MLKIKSFTFNPYQENTYLIFDDSKEAVMGVMMKKDDKIIRMETGATSLG